MSYRFGEIVAQNVAIEKAIQVVIGLIKEKGVNNEVEWIRILSNVEEAGEQRLMMAHQKEGFVSDGLVIQDWVDFFKTRPRKQKIDTKEDFILFLFDCVFKHFKKRKISGVWVYKQLHEGRRGDGTPIKGWKVRVIYPDPLPEA